MNTVRKICFIGNMASHYRKEIYIEMDSVFDIDWYFGRPFDGIKGMDISMLKNASILEREYEINTNTYSLHGMSELIGKYQVVIMTGEPAIISTWTLLLRYRLFNRNHKVYFWTHGWYGKEGILKRLVKKIYFKLASGIITYGEYARNLMIAEGFSKEKVWAIHNSLAYSEHVNIRENLKPSNLYPDHFKNNNKVLLFIGRLTKVKRLDLLIEVVSILKERGEFYNLVLIGDGPERHCLEDIVHSRNIEKEVWFYGASYNERDNAELIYNADLCVSPGNIGLTAIHVLTFGTPAATHNDFPYQMPEFEAIQEGLTGFFFKKDDVEDMVFQITHWFSIHKGDREMVRSLCFEEIDEKWNPKFQINLLCNILKD